MSLNSGAFQFTRILKMTQKVSELPIEVQLVIAQTLKEAIVQFPCNQKHEQALKLAHAVKESFSLLFSD